MRKLEFEEQISDRLLGIRAILPHIAYIPFFDNYSLFLLQNLLNVVLSLGVLHSNLTFFDDCLYFCRNQIFFSLGSLHSDFMEDFTFFCIC